MPSTEMGIDVPGITEYALCVTPAQLTTDPIVHTRGTALMWVAVR
jgi:hypothetical protein